MNNHVTNVEDLIERLHAHDEDAASQLHADFSFLERQPQTAQNHAYMLELEDAVITILETYEEV